MIMKRKNKRKFKLKKQKLLVLKHNLFKSRVGHKHQLDRINNLFKEQKDLNLNIQSIKNKKII